MPELPDVETFRQHLESTALGRRIASVHVTAPRMLERLSARSLQSCLEHRRFVRTFRHGKLLFAGLERDGWLVLHFGMTGFLKHYRSSEEGPLHTRLRIDFTDTSHLAFDDQRKFGRIAFTDEVDAFVQARRPGPDPLDRRFGFQAFKASVGQRRGAVKPALMNQQVIAGIGNIYADAILFQARLHPETRLDQLGEASLRDLYRVIKRVLTQAVQARADEDRMPRSYLLRHRQAGGRCPRCGRLLAQLKMGMRTAYYCPTDQPKERRGRASRAPTRV